MEFRLDEEQVELQSTVASFFADRFPLDRVGAREAKPVDRSDWSSIASLGVLGMLVPEVDGGVGLSPVDAAIVFEQLGSYLAPGPTLWTLLAAPFVEGAVIGEQLVGGVDISAVVDASAVVEHAADIDVLVVVGEDGVFTHLTAELPPPTPLDSLDPLTRVGRISGLGKGTRVGDATSASQLRTLGTLLSAATLVGVSSQSLEVAQAYALERHQFGAPIGSFQAVKHMLADMYVRHVSAQSAMYAAAAVLHDPGDDDVLRAVAGAKLLAADAAIVNASAAIQVLGGMGFTWDMLPNYLLKRAWVLENDFGTVAEHELLLGCTLHAAAR